ncbi:glycosyltransferase family protein [Geobacter argillaceus]|uniref:Glycosyltransferase involved in cell wall biosynthesis n=1 Tax=Geobacter argillaceus TaxID=345631 RepID=A0A562VFQ4_9BACT|nr:glycosyltransferase [Geobacter argillaceus]TWJ16712.1 glycosyltransferase involved in cell wall biosynthesis [Geobacter argillaceus]
MKRADNRLLIIAALFPDEKAGDGPWSERFNGLYGRLFRQSAGYGTTGWYALDVNRHYEHTPSGEVGRRKSLAAFFGLDLIWGQFRHRHTTLLIAYPLFKSRQSAYSIFFLLVLAVLRMSRRVKICLDFVDPPLMITKLYVRLLTLQKAIIFFRRPQEKAYLRLAHSIVVNSVEMGEHLRADYNLSSQEIMAVAMGTNVTDFVPDPMVGRRREFTVVYGGRLRGDRGALELINCLTQVNLTHPVRLLCCGPVESSLRLPDYPWLEIYPDLGYSDYVSLLVKRGDVGIIPYPANEWWEKVSISKLATYAAAGIPVLSTDLHHTTRFLARWNCGLTAASWKEMAELIVRLYEDRDLCMELGRNARNAAESELAWDILARRLADLLSQRFGRSLA